MESIITTKTTFTNLLREYEHQARTRTPKTENAYTKALTNLATAVTYSVLKKCIDVSQNKALTQIRQSVARDLNTLDSITYASENAFETAFNTDGDIITHTKDGELAKALSKLAGTTFGDGLDLVHDAIVAIMTETAKLTDLEGNFLERVYQVRRLKKKVWIKSEDSTGGWETVDTTTIQEIYRAVRQAIDNNRAAKINQGSGYTYIEDSATDTQSDTESIIYRRMTKYADLGGCARDFNGQETLYTVGVETVNDIDEFVNLMKLTARQAKVLQLRQSGYGDRAIATYLNVTLRAVQKTRILIQKKANDMGLNPPV